MLSSMDTADVVARLGNQRGACCCRNHPLTGLLLPLTVQATNGVSLGVDLAIVSSAVVDLTRMRGTAGRSIMAEASIGFSPTLSRRWVESSTSP